MAKSHPSRSPLTAWLPTPKAWLLVAAAVLAGIALFLLVRSRDQAGEVSLRAGDTPPTAVAPDYRPLPVPQGGSTGLDTPPPADADATAGSRPYIVEPRPAPEPPAPVTPVDAPPPPAEGARVPARPLAGRTPAPRYPRQALRRGESGTVLVQVDVGPDGVPTSVRVARSSNSRLLDRAAVDAVRRWRFEPATEGGRPGVDTVTIPIDFNPGG